LLTAPKEDSLASTTQQYRAVLFIITVYFHPKVNLCSERYMKPQYLALL